MNILITMRHSRNEYYSWIDVLENDYVSYFESMGANLIPLSNVTFKIDDYLSNFPLSGIVLTGGESINQDSFENNNMPYDLECARDFLEIKLLDKAVDMNIPVLGICRGMQFINLYFGGELHTVKEVESKKMHCSEKRHNIHVLNSDLRKLLETDKYEVNSYHEQAVLEERIPSELEIFAVSEEVRIVEGIRAKSSPIAGIQWHPERSIAKNMLNDRIVKAFLNKELFWE